VQCVGACSTNSLFLTVWQEKAKADKSIAIALGCDFESVGNTWLFNLIAATPRIIDWDVSVHVWLLKLTNSRCLHHPTLNSFFGSGERGVRGVEGWRGYAWQ
jgi:hypothetical protein